METLALQHRYAVMVWEDGIRRRVGVINANNHTAASTKAQRLYNHKVWVERLN